MSALVCGKRPSFEDLSPGSTSPPFSLKRARRSSGSPSRHFGGVASLDGPNKLEILQNLFPAMTEQELQFALEECDHDLDLTIQNLSALRLVSTSGAGKAADWGNGPDTSAGAEARASTAVPLRTSLEGSSGVPGSGPADAAAGSPSSRVTPEPGAAAERLLEGTESVAGQGRGDAAASEDAAAREDAASAVSAVLSAEWVDAVVQEMMAARDMDDARQRAARALQSFGAAVARCASQAKEQDARQLQQQVLALQKENHILKRAVAIQHERQRAHEGREAELSSLKQTLMQYQEQLRKLEMSNYALSLHLQKAQVSSTISGRFHPDIF